MNSKNKYSLFALGVLGTAAAAIVPITLQTKSSENIEQKIYANQSAEGIYAKTQYELNENSFVDLFMTYQQQARSEGIYYNPIIIKNYYNSHREKANVLLEQVNTWNLQRSFWSAIWNGIKGVGVAIATGFTEVANVVSGGALQGTVDSLAHTTGQLMYDATKEWNKVNWNAFLHNLVNNLGTIASFTVPQLIGDKLGEVIGTSLTPYVGPLAATFIKQFGGDQVNNLVNSGSYMYQDTKNPSNIYEIKVG